MSALLCSKYHSDLWEFFVCLILTRRFICQDNRVQYILNVCIVGFSDDDCNWLLQYLHLPFFVIWLLQYLPFFVAAVSTSGILCRLVAAVSASGIFCRMNWTWPDPGTDRMIWCKTGLSDVRSSWWEEWQTSEQKYIYLSQNTWTLHMGKPNTAGIIILWSVSC